MNIGIYEEIRQQNILFLEKQGFPVNENLPLLDIQECCKIEKEIAERINILHIFYAIYLEGGESRKFFYKLIKKEGWSPFLSKSEKNMLSGLTLKEQQLVNFSWFKESIFMLLWCANKKLINSEKTEEIDIADIYSLIPPEKEHQKFIESLKLRETYEMLLELDLYYNLHWLAKHYEDLGSTKKLNLSVIVERRKALEWILNKNADWDDVNLDT